MKAAGNSCVLTYALNAITSAHLKILPGFGEGDRLLAVVGGCDTLGRLQDIAQYAAAVVGRVI